MKNERHSAIPEEEVIRHKRTFLSPLIKKISYDNHVAIHKDYGNTPFYIRSWLCPYLVRREYHLLKRLEHVQGIPRVLKCIEGKRPGLIIEYIEGRHIHKFKEDKLPPSVFANFRDIVNRIHQHDIVHLDLRQKKNILITADQHVYIIDFTNALHIRPYTFLRSFFVMMKHMDISGMLKFKQRYMKGRLHARERMFLNRYKRMRSFWIFRKRRQRAHDQID